MKVSQLIEILQAKPQDAEVVLFDDSCGWLCAWRISELKAGDFDTGIYEDLLEGFGAKALVAIE